MAQAPLVADPTWAIRSAHSSDLPWLYEVCRATVDLGDAPDQSHEQLDPYLVGQLYLAPYLAFEPAATALLSVDGRVQGYVVGTSDSRAFEAFLGSDWLPKVQKQYPLCSPGLIARDSAFLKTLHGQRPELSAWLNSYPAHFHADLLPPCQGRGFGRLLFNRFCQYLKSVGSVGVHVDVARRNTGAIAFYRALGLRVLLEETASGVTLGKRLA